MPAHVGLQRVERFGFDDGVDLLEELGIGDVEFGKVWCVDGGKVAVQGEVGRGDDDFVAIRLDPAGAPDPSFGSNGVATIDLGGDDEPRGLVRGAGGELYLAGTSRQNGNAYFAAAKLSTPAATDDVIFRDGFDVQ